MVKDIRLEISIPSDVDGFVLLKCPLCGELFKLKPNDFENEFQLNIWCPRCGLISDNWFTDDFFSLAQKITNNYAAGLLDDLSKDLSRNLNSKNVKFKKNSKVKKEQIDPIISIVDNLEIQSYGCCKKEAKINPNLKIEGGYCPFCGEMKDGN